VHRLRVPPTTNVPLSASERQSGVGSRQGWYGATSDPYMLVPPCMRAEGGRRHRSGDIFPTRTHVVL
jgi:hypothetical protein